jgi:hypothetical protein
LESSAAFDTSDIRSAFVISFRPSTIVSLPYP